MILLAETRAGGYSAGHDPCEAPPAYIRAQRVDCGTIAESPAAGYWSAPASHWVMFFTSWGQAFQRQ